MTELEDHLREFRATESMSSAMLVIDDTDAKKLLAAWTTFPPVPWAQPQSEVPTDARHRWDWIWSGVPVELDELARAAGVSVHVAPAKWRVLVAGRLVYPDGTISSAADAALRAHVAAHVGRRPGRPRKEV